ncbi:MAG TPA: malate dehydrogenase, partial [Pirellulales bacterium]|nr:malate dehydrogenase [Pirellulales bacterium]
MTADPRDLPPITLAISGAAGAVGYGLVFRIAAGAMFGAQRHVSLRLLEHSDQMQRLQATAMELTDCAFPLLDSFLVTDDPLEAFAGADWIVLLAGSPVDVPRTSRVDVLKANGQIYVEHGRAINKASPSARILVVAAPCNANCMIAMSQAHDVPKQHWFALNRLDRMRATALIAQRAGVPVSQVSRVNVWGNHSDLMYIDFHNAFIGDQPAHEVVNDVQWAHEKLQQAVAHRSAEIFRLRGRSPIATATQAILGTIHSICTPTQFERRFGAAVYSDGSYGIPRGLIFGFPLRTEDGLQWSIEQGLYL